MIQGCVRDTLATLSKNTDIVEAVERAVAAFERMVDMTDIVRDPERLLCEPMDWSRQQLILRQCTEAIGPVSYTHLTLPTICSV